MHYIGIDCHSATMNFAVMDQKGRLLLEGNIYSNKVEFMSLLKTLPRPRKIYIEEGEYANWLLEASIEAGEHLIITDSRRNKWIGSSQEEKNDSIDARKLASLARGGYIKELYHPVFDKRRLKELVKTYHDTVKMMVMTKNKIKSLFRREGIKCKGKTVYLEAYRAEWLSKLPPLSSLHLIVTLLWSQLDNLRNGKKLILKELKKESKKYPQISNIRRIPGIGFIRAITIYAIISTPARFKNKRKLWGYAGFGIVTRSSGDKIYSQKLTRNFNRLLKNTVRQSVLSSISGKDNQFRKQYETLVFEKGKREHRARLTVARTMLAVIYSIWKNGKKYDTNYRNL